MNDTQYHNKNNIMLDTIKAEMKTVIFEKRIKLIMGTI